MKTQKGEITTLAVLSGALIALALLLSNLIGQVQTLKNASDVVALGSVTMGNEYQSTTTVRVTGVNNLTGLAVLKSTPGALGSVVVTGAGTGRMFIFNATSTTDVSSTTLAIIPASATAGTYTFDVEAPRGLIVQIIGQYPTTTVTYR